MALQILPGEVGHFFPGNKEVPGSLSELREVDDIVGGSFRIRVNGCFRTHKSDICLSRNNSGHCLIRAESAHKIQVDSLIFKISLFDRHIHGRVEDGMGYFVQSYFGKSFFFRFLHRSLAFTFRFLFCLLRVP